MTNNLPPGVKESDLLVSPSADMREQVIWDKIYKAIAPPQVATKVRALMEEAYEDGYRAAQEYPSDCFSDTCGR